MRIKQLELLGFKSFKQKTILTFPPGITAIVGPNGCGKSNIVDALRWVMGEQSPRQLRGHEMSDVVFAGNASTAPLGMAEVSLILENEVTPTLAEERGVHQWNEVMVSRRYFRSGESEYLFNKVPCRLRDIVEFFLGTGAGTKAYAVIEQGRVDHLLHAKPEEIRALIDEAAGVSLYRSRRVAAERKLERTRDNLARVSDVLREMERQLSSLRRQARKAEQYNLLREELKALDLMLLSNAYRKWSAEIAQLEGERQEVVQRLILLSGQEQELTAARAQAAAAFSAEEEALRAVEARRHAIERASQQREQKRQFLLQQEQDLVGRIAAAEQEGMSLEEKRAQVCEESRDLAARLEELQQLVCADEKRVRAYEEEAQTLHHTLVACEGEAERLKTDIVDLLTREAQEQNALSYARKRGAEIVQRMHILTREAERIAEVRTQHEQALTSICTRVARLQERLTYGQQQHAEKTSGLRQLVSTAEHLDGELAVAWARQAELRARLTTLEEMEARYDRYSPGVRSIMSGNGTPAAICGVVAQVVEVPEEYERAVAAVLREKLEYVVVPGIEDGLKAVEYLRDTGAGRGSFIPLTPRVAVFPHPHHKTDAIGIGERNDHAMTVVGEGSTRLLALLTVDQRYRDLAEFLLGDAILVPDLRAGLQLWQQNGVARTFVTPNGEVITAQGVVSGGSEGFAEEVLLERRREIRTLTEEVRRHDARVADLVRRRQEVKRSQQELEGEILRLETEARSLGQEREALHREATRLEGELRRLLDKNEHVTYERRALESEQQTLAQEMRTREEREAALRAQREACETALTAAQAEVARVKELLEQQRARIDELRIRIAEQRERQTSTRAQLARLHDQQKELEQRIALCHTEVEATRDEVDKIRRSATELAEQLLQDEAALAVALQEQSLRQATSVQLRTQCHTYDEALGRVRGEYAQLQETKTQLEVRLAEKRTECAHVETTIRERYDLRLEEVLHQYQELAVDEAEGERRRQELREKIARLGEVNPEAVLELAEVEQRYAFLQTQEADLRRSVADLQHSMAKLNRESRERFRDTFAQVNEKFAEVYARLVEGGKAHLMLTDDENWAETGVEIVVQPPGKRLRSLHLLSGGEKALAALSFTFALFLIRPSPFCILDEVDAALDDANVGRFNQLLQEMSRSTQIIVVTHNKRTMEAANTLYGVTMQESGVSTIVSVRMT